MKKNYFSTTVLSMLFHCSLHLYKNSFSSNDNETKELKKAWKAKGKEMGRYGLWLELL